MAARPHFAASVQSKKGRLYAVIQVKKDGTTKPVWRTLGLPEGANKTKINKAFREVVAQYEQEYWENLEREGRTTVRRSRVPVPGRVFETGGTGAAKEHHRQLPGDDQWKDPPVL